MYTDLPTLCVEQTRSVREAMSQMDQSRLGIILVVDTDRRLVGTVTDGDVRRALLASVDLRQSVMTLLARKSGTPFAHPITAPAGADRNRYLELLKQHNILHLPLLDTDGHVTGLVTMDCAPETSSIQKPTWIECSFRKLPPSELPATRRRANEGKNAPPRTATSAVPGVTTTISYVLFRVRTISRSSGSRSPMRVPSRQSRAVQ